jgi:hypothetical protein
MSSQPGADFRHVAYGPNMTDAELLAAVRKRCWRTIEEDKSVYAVARFAAAILDIIGRQRDGGNR